MSLPEITCANCGFRSPAGTRYCLSCGQAIDPAIIEELRWLYAALQDLDQRVKDGQGERALRDLAQDYRERYLALRLDPHWVAEAAPRAQPAPRPEAGRQPPPLTARTAPQAPVSPAPISPPVPAGPPFSWRAFFAEQAIAIMAYLGGFLLLVATLAFEIGRLSLTIGGVNFLTDSVKLGVVVAVYLIFGLLGLTLGRMHGLRTVGQAYLGVFALMTPLVALALYLFQLQGQGVPVAGMLSLSALYATVVYLALALRTRVWLYAVLGWVALIVAAQATIPWLGAPSVWWSAVLAATGFVMLLVVQIRRGVVAEILAGPALTLAALAGAVSFAAAAVLDFVVALDTALANRTALAATSIALIGVTALLARTARILPQKLPSPVLAMLDLVLAVMVAQTIFALTAWATTDHDVRSLAFAGAALVESAGVIALRRAQPARVNLRVGVLALALALGVLGWGLTAGDAIPDWALVLALAAATLVPLAALYSENAPWWLAIAGIFFSFAWHAATINVLASVPAYQTASPASALQFVLDPQLGLVVLLWLAAIVLARRYSTPLIAVMLGNTIAVSAADLAQANPPLTWLPALLLAFALAAWAHARVTNQVWISAATAVYLTLAALTTPARNLTGISALDAIDPFGGAALALTVVVVAAGIAVRLRSNLAWAAAIYAGAAVASFVAIARSVTFTGAHSAGQIEATWLICAALAYVLVAFEREPWVAAAPAFYAIGAVLTQPDAHALLPLALISATLGIVVGRTGGWRWSWPMYVVAIVAIVATALRGVNDATFEAVALASMALVTYVAVIFEGLPEAIPGPLVLGGLALAATGNALHAAPWQVVLAFAGLGWLYALLEPLWRSLPARAVPVGIVSRVGGDSRAGGALIHRWAGVGVSAGTALVGAFALKSFAPHAPATEAATVAIAALALLLAVEARLSGPHELWYVAGLVGTIAIAWQTRWLGADNVQAYVLWPGSYLILAGVLLSADERMGRPQALSQATSIAGALLLLVPTLGQTLTPGQDWQYTLWLAVEALILSGVGVGTRSRSLTYTGTAFVGLAAIRGGIVAVNSGLPVALVIAFFAVLLMGGATWLSLRARRVAGE